MIIRKASDRGLTKTDWLTGYHTFSFGNYVDRAWHHFGVLRVINDDTVAPGGGFPPHPHQDMEIITYVLDGTLAHKDSMGNAETISAGEVQLMRAGSGITHSEYNFSQTAPVHLLQIWIMPEAKGLAPAYQQFKPDTAQRHNRWHLIVGPNGTEAPLTIAQDAALSLADLNAGTTLTLAAAAGRAYWLHVATGELLIGGQRLTAGDAMGIQEVGDYTLSTQSAANLLLFDMAA